MLKLAGVSIHYSEVSIYYPDLHVKPGQVVGIYGANGCGKSSLLDALAAPFFRGGFCYEAALVAGRAWREWGPDKYQWWGYCPQFAQNALNPWLTLEQHLLLAAKGAGRRPRGIGLYMQGLGLEYNLLACYPRQLSGGQKQRFALLLSIIKDPSLLFIDEPTAGIDQIAQFHMIGFINGLRGSRAIVITSHNLPFLDRIADYIVRLGG